jgi:hypothetical protein
MPPHLTIQCGVLAEMEGPITRWLKKHSLFTISSLAEGRRHPVVTFLHRFWAPGVSLKDQGGVGEPSGHFFSTSIVGGDRGGPRFGGIAATVHPAWERR